jgi:hypothetical protein
LTWDTVGNITLGGPDAAAPAAQTLKAQSVVAGTSNTAGANWTINGSKGTGTGAGGNIIFQTAKAGTTGTSQNPLQANLTISPTAFVGPGAGTATAAPLQFTSGTNLTTAAAGAFEFDGSVLYGTCVASARQVISTEQIQILSGSRTFTNNTSAQAIFNATANGAVTLAATTTYEFEMLVAATGFSASAHTLNLTFATSGSFTSIAYYFDAQTASVQATPSASATGFIAVGTASAICASSTTTGLLLYVRGTIRMNAGGTVTPQLTQVTNSAAAVVQANSFFRCWPIGTNTVTNVGNWS